MRLFVSIDPPAQIRLELAKWVPDNPGIRKTAPENIHLTLLFLGEMTREKGDEIFESLEKVSFTPFEITVRGLGAFPDKSNPSVIWAGTERSPELIRLQKRIKNRLTPFAKEEEKSFRPHLTLARVTKPALAGPDIFSDTPLPLTFGVSGFSLKKSVLRPSGAVHKVWKRFPSDKPTREV